MISNPASGKALPWIPSLLGAIACIAVWEANSHFHLYQTIAPSLSPSAFPSFLSILCRLGALAQLTIFWKAVSVTTIRTLSAFSIAAFLGIFFGLLAGRVPLIRALLNVPAEFLRNLPAIAAMPVCILFFGIGTPMKITLCVFGSLFPIFIAARSGIQNISQEIHIASRFYRWSGWRLLFLVLLPAALPEIVLASQTALAISLILAITGEMLIGSDGLGSMIVDAERTFDHLNLYALILALGMIGCMLAFSFRCVTSRIIFWKAALHWDKN